MKDDKCRDEYKKWLSTCKPEVQESGYVEVGLWIAWSTAWATKNTPNNCQLFPLPVSLKEMHRVYYRAYDDACDSVRSIEDAQLAGLKGVLDAVGIKCVA